jgi:putative intracellular protease/amidase
MPPPPNRVLIPIPARDFDPTEVAIPWQILTQAGQTITFATPDGDQAAADEIMLTGQGLDPWGAIPGLRRLPAFGLMLRARAPARAAYAAMRQTPEFRAPIAWSAIDPAAFDGLILPGGHRARFMRAYLESPILQQAVAAFFAANKPVGAICHGVVLAARSKMPGTNRSVLHGRRTTALTWALERSAWSLTRITRFWDPNYYRTYSETAGDAPGAMSVQQEVTRALADPADFLDVPKSDPQYRRKTGGIARDTPTDPSLAFVVQDGPYISARWPGDAHAFAHAFAATLAASPDHAEPEPAISQTAAISR